MDRDTLLNESLNRKILSLFVGNRVYQGHPTLGLTKPEPQSTPTVVVQSVPTEETSELIPTS